MTLAADDKPEKFWKEVAGYPKAVPLRKIADALIASLPEDAEDVRFCSRVKGGGSLGRPRFVAIAFWRGGQVLREAKALVPSAWTWAHGGKSQTSSFLDLANGKYRAPDPFLKVSDSDKVHPPAYCRRFPKNRTRRRRGLGSQSQPF